MEPEKLPHERRHWHLDKSVSIGHIITTLAMVTSALVWAFGMDKRVAVLETELAHSQRADERIEREWRDALLRFDAALIRIESKLDNKADKK